MSTVIRLTVAALLASAGALAQTPETAPRRADQGPPDAGSLLTPREKAAAQATEQAKKDVDVAGIHLQVAKLYRNTVGRAQGQLRSLSVPLRTGGGQDQAGQSVIGQIYKSLDSSRDELNSAARAMGVDTKLRTP